MAEGNGSTVTRAELAAHIKGIDNKFEDIAADISEIRWSLHEMVRNRRQSRLAYFPAIIAALISAGIALPVALFH